MASLARKVSPGIEITYNKENELWYTILKDDIILPHLTTAAQLQLSKVEPCHIDGMTFISPLWATKKLLPTPPYDFRLIDSFVIQTRGERVLAVRGGTEAQDKRCDNCKKGNGMYAECIYVPRTDDKKFGGLEGACGNCWRAGKQKECRYHSEGKPEIPETPATPKTPSKRRRLPDDTGNEEEGETRLRRKMVPEKYSK